jgi:predicted DNA-binding transcriptional regulator YafY
MRAARLLQILLLLQNRGRQTARQLASELEVAPRTILRDVDAMTEAGLPIIVHQGNRGGIELGFNYRTRLTGLAQDEAEALGLILSARNPLIAALDLDHAAARARAKLVESLPDAPPVAHGGHDREICHVINHTEEAFGLTSRKDQSPSGRSISSSGKRGCSFMRR